MSEDISFYSTNNPASSPRPCPISPNSHLLSPGCSPSKFNIENTVQLSRNFSQDSTSMDSGYYGSLSNNKLSSTSVASTFKFIEPRRPSTSSPSAQKTPSKFALSSSMNSSGRSFRVLSSGSCDPTEDEFMDLMDLENFDGESSMPCDMDSLISKDIKKTPERFDLSARKRLNMNGGGSGVKNSLFSSPLTPKSSTITSLITTPERQCFSNLSSNITPIRSTTGAFKRPEPPSVCSPVQSKRMKCENEEPKESAFHSLSQEVLMPQKRPTFRKSMSMNDANLMNAVKRADSESNLVGDFSRPHCLPLVQGKHDDLKSISADTMRRLLDGDFQDRVSSFKIIDCRYPYEYEGGHIPGAINLYTPEQILEEFMKNPSQTSAPSEKRDIIIFHCEFSSERGPKL